MSHGESKADVPGGQPSLRDLEGPPHRPSPVFNPPVRDGVSGVGQCDDGLALFHAVGKDGRVVVLPLNGRVGSCPHDRV